MLPEFDVFGVSVKTFGLCFALAFLISGWLLSRRFKELGWPGEQATEGLLAALVGGLVGARVYWLIDNWGENKEDIVGSLFGGAGLTWYGGAIGGALAVIAWAKWRGRLNGKLLDATAPVLALGYAVGRIGCQVSGDGDFGRASNSFFAMRYPKAISIPEGFTAEDMQTQKFIATPIIETVSMALVALLLWQLRDRFRPKVLFAIYLVLAGAERLIVEFWRRNPDVALGLTSAQVTSVVMIAAGAGWLAYLSRSGGGLARA